MFRVFLASIAMMVVLFITFSYSKLKVFKDTALNRALVDIDGSCSFRESFDLDNSILFLGDSRIKDWKQTSPEKLEKKAFFLGVYGQTSAELIREMKCLDFKGSNKKVVLQIGVNDLKVISLFPDLNDSIISNLKRNMIHIVELLKEQDFEIFILPIIPISDSFDEWFFLWKDKSSASILHTNEFIESSLGDATIINISLLLNSKNVVDDLYAKDSLHLNAHAYGALNNSLKDYL